MFHELFLRGGRRNVRFFCTVNPCGSKKAERVKPIRLFVERQSAALIAPTGQAASQAPQSMHSSALTTYFPSPSLIAPTGHSPAQDPQERHSSLITRAIMILSLKIYLHQQ